MFGIQRLQHARKRRAKPSKLYPTLEYAPGSQRVSWQVCITCLEMQLVQVIECILQLLLLLLRAVFGWLGLGWMIAGHFCYFQGAVSRFTDSDGCKAQTDGELKLLRARFDEWWERDEGAVTAAEYYVSEDECLHEAGIHPESPITEQSTRDESMEDGGGDDAA